VSGIKGALEVADNGSMDTAESKERRRMPRAVREGKIKLALWRAGKKTGVTVPAIVKDISPRGLGLLCADALSVGDYFVISDGLSHFLFSVVRRRQVAEGYRIGAHFAFRLGPGSEGSHDNLIRQVIALNAGK
jgi:hypothetical protein